MELENLVVQAEGSTGSIVLDRPQRLNALTPGVLEDLITAARWFDGQKDVTVVVVSGSGSSFSGGYDLDAFQAMPDDIVERRELAGLGGRMAEALEGMRAVTVARLHGWVVGGGVVIASACDLRIASEDTRFKIPEVELGIPLNWAGIPRLVREIGPALTRELVMTCREFSPQEAAAAGFLNRVVPADQLDTEVHALVARIHEMPVLPVLITKDQVNAVTAAMSARIGHYMDGDGFLGITSSAEFGEDLERYTGRVRGEK